MTAVRTSLYRCKAIITLSMPHDTFVGANVLGNCVQHIFAVSSEQGVSSSCAVVGHTYVSKVETRLKRAHRN